MTFLFGGRPPREDPELAEAARRRREAFARDIGDEHTLAWSREQPTGTRHRRRWTPVILLALVLFAALGAIPLFRSGGEGGLVRRQCDRPVLGVSPARVAPGGKAAWQAAGPESGPYLLTLDADRITSDADGRPTVPSGRLLAGPFGMPDCRSPQTLFDAPAVPGEHLVTLFRKTPHGYSAVARAGLTVR